MPLIFNISSNLNFLESLAKGVIGKYGDRLEDVTIYLPTRRAMRPLAEAFLELSGEEALILPRIQPIGDIDEEELNFRYFPDYEKVEPAIPDTLRLYSLARLIAEKDGLHEFRPNFAQSISLARSLINLMDELHNADLELDALDGVVPEEFAEHWQVTVTFLKNIAGEWQEFLARNNYIEPVKRRNKLIRQLANYYNLHKPESPVVIAGTTGTISATVELVKAITALPNGALVLDGLDRNLRAEDFKILEETHPQFGLSRLLKNLDVEVGEVAEWEKTELTARQKMVSTTLFPTGRTSEWKDAECSGEGVYKLEAANIEEEAGAIAFALREVLEEKEKTALVVTNNRALALRISAKMKVWGVEINDSAGQSMLKLPASTFLLEMVEMLRSRQAPVEVLSFFKHPFIASGVKAKIRELEKKSGSGLRGAREEDFDIAEHGLKYPELVELGAMFRQDKANLLELFDRHIKAAEVIAGKEKLWDRYGVDVLEFLEEFRASISPQHEVDPGLYPEILAQFLSTKTYRPKFGLHKRLDILSPSEARMQRADVVVIAGMNEGSFPPLPEADSFMNQQIRKKIGLELPSRKIGQSAHDFELLSQAETIIYTRSKKEGSSPAVPSRFLQRLEAVCEISQAQKYLDWAREIHEPAEVKAAPRPEPRPPLEARPRELSATRVGELMADPYVVYAKKILRLKKLDPIDEEITASKFGNFIHAALEIFSKNYDGNLQTLIDIGRKEFKEFENKVGAQTFWWPKFVNIAGWFVKNEENLRRPGLRQEFEVSGEYKTNGMTYTAKADRVEVDSTVKVIDYKTGTPPAASKVESGISPQLAIEAIIFSELYGKPPGEIEYWQLKGRDEVVKITRYSKDLAELVDSTRQGLEELAKKYLSEKTPYLARPWSRFALPYNDYEHLERIKEWEDS